MSARGWYAIPTVGRRGFKTAWIRHRPATGVRHVEAWQRSDGSWEAAIARDDGTAGEWHSGPTRFQAAAWALTDRDV